MPSVHKGLAAENEEKSRDKALTERTTKMSQYKDLEKNCICGREHPILTDPVLISRDAYRKLPQLLAERNLEGHPVLVWDDNTRQAAASRLLPALPGAEEVVLPAAGLKADERGVALLEGKLAGLTSPSTVLLAVGAGTVHDLTRFAAFRGGLPFLSVPTAASVDGFVSGVAAMTWEGMKKTFPSRSPIAAVVDLEVVSQAPSRLTASGVGDILGKYICLADWKIASMVTDEYYCPQVVQLEEEALQKVVDSLEQIAAREPEGYRSLMEGLILSGIAMQMVGNSRPASCAEHHISHFWEMGLVNSVDHDALHGEKVGVGAVVLADLYKRSVRSLGQFCSGSQPVNHYSAQLMNQLFGKFGPAMALENRDNPSSRVKPELVRIHLGDICRVVENLPSSDQLARLLNRVGGRCRYGQLGVTREDMDRTLQNCCYVRSRLSLLRILRDYQLCPLSAEGAERL